MELTARKAVELSIELWGWLAETGKEKEDWPEWEVNGGQYAGVRADCFLCEYDVSGSCDDCPYYIKYRQCNTGGEPYDAWSQAENKTDSKKYAKEFLNQLKKILKDMEA